MDSGVVVVLAAVASREGSHPQWQRLVVGFDRAIHDVQTIELPSAFLPPRPLADATGTLYFRSVTASDPARLGVLALHARQIRVLSVPPGVHREAMLVGMQQGIGMLLDDGAVGIDLRLGRVDSDEATTSWFVDPTVAGVSHRGRTIRVLVHMDTSILLCTHAQTGAPAYRRLLDHGPLSSGRRSFIASADGIAGVFEDVEEERWRLLALTLDCAGTEALPLPK